MKRCCFFASLQNAGRIIGWLGIIKAIICVVLGIIVLARVAAHRQIDETTLESEYLSGIILIIVGVISSAMSTCLLLGIKKQKSSLILVWLTIHGIGFISYMYQLIVLVTNSKNMNESLVAYKIAVVALAIYFWIVILNLYAEIKEISEKTENSEVTPNINHGGKMPNFFARITTPTTVPYVQEKI